MTTATHNPDNNTDKRYRRIAVIAAMDKEAALLRSLLGDDAEERHDGRIPMTVGRIGDTEVAIAKSGIGKVNAALATRDIIEDRKSVV